MRPRTRLFVEVLLLLLAAFCGIVACLQGFDVIDRTPDLTGWFALLLLCVVLVMLIGRLVALAARSEQTPPR